MHHMLPMDCIKEAVSSIIRLPAALATAITKPSQAWTMSAQSRGKVFTLPFDPPLSWMSMQGCSWSPCETPKCGWSTIMKRGCLQGLADRWD